MIMESDTSNGNNNNEIAMMQTHFDTSIYTNNPLFANNIQRSSSNSYHYHPYSPHYSPSSSSSSSSKSQQFQFNFNNSGAAVNNNNKFPFFNFLAPPPPPPPPPLLPPAPPPRPIVLLNNHQPFQIENSANTSAVNNQLPLSFSSSAGYEFRQSNYYPSNNTSLSSISSSSVMILDEDMHCNLNSSTQCFNIDLGATAASFRLCKSHMVIHVVHSRRVEKPPLQVSIVPITEQEGVSENICYQQQKNNNGNYLYSSPLKKRNYSNNIYSNNNGHLTVGPYHFNNKSILTDTSNQIYQKTLLQQNNVNLTSSPIRRQQQQQIIQSSPSSVLPQPPPPPPPHARPISPPNIPPLILRQQQQQQQQDTFYMQQSNTNSPRLDSLDTSNLNTSYTFVNSTLVNSFAVCNNSSRIGNDNVINQEFLMSPHLKTLYNLKKTENAKLPPPPPYQPPSSTYSIIRKCSFDDFKAYMEQHYVENVLRSIKDREKRRLQFEKEMEKLDDLDDEEKKALRLIYFKRESNYLRLRRTKMNKNMFKILKILGLGAFGEVYLVSKKEAKVEENSKLYAMKVLSKNDIFRRNHAAHIKAERDILVEAANTDWVVKLYYTFQDDESLYFVMDYVPGGDLMYLLIKRGIFDEPMARFYIGELTCAIECVHELGFIHRDIKPDNVLIDKDGHIKLTDFGLCTRFDRETFYHNSSDLMDEEINTSNSLSIERKMAYSLVGSPNYIAPEVLLRKGYTKACDWWSLGIIMYEMLIGHAPFFDERAEITQRKIENWKQTFRIPDQCNLSEEAHDLISKLCTDAETRLDSNTIKMHPFFKNSFDFNSATVRLNNKPPFVPIINSLDDTSNFEPISEQALAEHKHKINKIFATHSNYNQHLATVNHPRLYEFTFRRFDDNYFPSTVTHFWHK